ncbi:MAG: putative lipid II flippase FtsW [Armatimonadota bacterium]|nr:putative lipid II flippase FtsW [Armatimonadota bacterium]MDW8156920.1 putative lipid II flippase FtsW [Armatimonadota bacterium]
MTRPSPPQEIRRGPVDGWLVASVLGLCGVGLVMVYSASSVAGFERFGDASYFLKRQLAWFTLGCGCMVLTSRVHYTAWRRLAAPLVVASLLLLGAVLVPGIGDVAGGARRWISAGPVNFQPVEVAKFSLVAYLAHFLANRRDQVRSLTRGVLPPLGFAGAMAVLVLRQPDMGSAVVLVGIAAAVLFCAGARLHHLGGLAVVAAPAAAWAALAEPYRRERILAFLDPWRDAQGSGFHVIQSLVAVASGGLVGVGLGQSRQKFFYLPERHTDFIFAILAEELGLAGVVVVVGLYAVLVARIYRAALRAPDRYGALLASGFGAWVAGQAVLNLGVATGLLPVTGVPLPFVSFGGSSLVSLMAAAGVCMNLSQYARAVREADVFSAWASSPARERAP